MIKGGEIPTIDRVGGREQVNWLDLKTKTLEIAKESHTSLCVMEW